MSKYFPDDSLHFNKKITDLVPELLDFIFSVLDSALQSCFGSVMLFLQVLYLLQLKKQTENIQNESFRKTEPCV